MTGIYSTKTRFSEDGSSSSNNSGVHKRSLLFNLNHQLRLQKHAGCRSHSIRTLRFTEQQRDGKLIFKKKCLQIDFKIIFFTYTPAYCIQPVEF